MPPNLELERLFFCNFPPHFLFPTFQNSPRTEAPSCRHLSHLQTDSLSPFSVCSEGRVLESNHAGVDLGL